MYPKSNEQLGHGGFPTGIVLIPARELADEEIESGF